MSLIDLFTLQSPHPCTLSLILQFFHPVTLLRTCLSQLFPTVTRTPTLTDTCTLSLDTSSITQSCIYSLVQDLFRPIVTHVPNHKLCSLTNCHLLASSFTYPLPTHPCIRNPVRQRLTGVKDWPQSFVCNCTFTYLHHSPHT